MTSLVFHLTAANKITTPRKHSTEKTCHKGKMTNTFKRNIKAAPHFSVLQCYFNAIWPQRQTIMKLLCWMLFSCWDRSCEPFSHLNGMQWNLLASRRAAAVSQQLALLPLSKKVLHRKDWGLPDWRLYVFFMSGWIFSSCSGHSGKVNFPLV